MPNFNVARVKRDPDEAKVGVKKEGGAGTGKQRKKQDHRKDKKDKKERPELIQTMGSVFSEVRSTKDKNSCPQIQLPL